MRSFAKSLISGLGQMANIWPKVEVKGYEHRNELEALRGDTRRIGDDMRRVFNRHADKK